MSARIRLATAALRGVSPARHGRLEVLAAGHDADEVLAAYPYLERDDIRQALAYAASDAFDLE